MSRKTSDFFFRWHLKFPRSELFHVHNVSQMLLTFGVMLFALAQAFIIGSKFNWLHVDADQLLIAEQAKWISRGLIFEPNFYGQNYLIPLDSYLSSILVLFGINPLHAVQVCTVFFFYAPFVVLVSIFQDKRFNLLVSLVLLLLFLPFKFLIVAQMPRAFTTIISIACLALIWCLLRSNESTKKVSFALGVLFGICLGAFTGALLLAPALLLFKKKNVFIVGSLGCLLGFLLCKSSGLFYYLNPHYVVHTQSVVTLSASDFLMNWMNPSIRTPILSLFLPGFLIIIYGHFRVPHLPRVARIQALLAFFGFLAVLFAMLATPKIRDFAPDSPFYSLERMLVGVPYFFVLMVVHLGSFEQKNDVGFFQFKLPLILSKKINTVLSILILLGLGIQIRRLNNFILVNRDKMAGSPSPSQVKSIAHLREHCSALQERYMHNKDVYLFFNGRDDAIVYGCSAFMGMPTVQAEYERRTWLVGYFENIGLKRIIHHP